MTLLHAVKILIALGCLSDPKEAEIYERTSMDQYMDTGRLQVIKDPKKIRAYADAIEFNNRREKECPKAWAVVMKLVEGK